MLCGVALVAGGPVHAADGSDPVWRAAHQLISAQRPSGQFTFEHDFLLGGQRPDTEVGMGRVAYITREAVAAYGLSQYLLQDKDPAIAHAIVAALRNFGKLSLPIAKNSGQGALEATRILALPFGRYKLEGMLRALGLLYRPSGEGLLLSYNRSYDTAWGGATALALLTELQYYRSSHDARFAPLRRAWLKGLLVLYDGVGGFRTLPDSIDENDLSNGEIWLALANYTRLFPADRATADIVARVDNYLMRNFAGRSDAIYYSWAVKAAAERHAANPNARYVEFIAQLTRTFLDSFHAQSASTENSCAHVEGLAAARRVLNSVTQPDRDLVRRLKQRIDREMTKNLALQILPGQTRIELGSGAYLSSPNVADYAGAFLAGRYQPYVRIDYTQHCLSAMIELTERQSD